MNEFSTNASELWVLKNDLCRCCHAEGTFESLGVPINDLGESTEFSNMLEFIGIEIEPKQGYLGRATFKICDACIAQLQSAYNFKEQVMSCENSFQMLCEKNLIKVPDDEEVKSEKLESDDEDGAISDRLESGPGVPDDNEVNLENLESDDEDGAISDSPESGPGDEMDHEIEDILEEITVIRPQTRRQYGGKFAAKPKKQVQAEIRTETGNSTKNIDLKEIKKRNNNRKNIRIVTLAKYETVKKTAEKPKKSDVKSETRAEKKYKARTPTAPTKAGIPVLHIGSWKSDVIKVNGLYRCNVTAESWNKTTTRFADNCDQVQHKHKEEIHKHLARAHYTFKCIECPERCKTKLDLHRHLLTEHKIDTIIQGYPVQYIGSWTSAVIEKNGLYRCNANAVSFNKRFAAKCDQVQHKNKEEILQHLARVHYRYRCTECPERFRDKQVLNRHLLAEHNINKIKQFSCGSCDKVFNTKVQYKKHLQSYHKLGELRKCDKCDYETYLESSMRQHVLNHMDARPFSCRFCEKTFKRGPTRNLHERIHTREGLKQCPYCEQSFVQRSSVKYHVLKHHPGEKI